MLVHTPGGDEDPTMADGHFQDVETLRRELAILVLEWAGKAVKDDPEGPMSTALSRAVSEAARIAVADQHQSLSAQAADQIAEALHRRANAENLQVWRRRPWMMGLVVLVAVLLLTAAFLLGQQAGRLEPAPPPETATTAAPIAPLAPPVEAPSTVASPKGEPAQPTAKSQKPLAQATARASRPQPRELGRPAAANDEAASRSTQPVGAATLAPPAAPTPATPR